MFTRTRIANQRFHTSQAREAQLLAEVSALRSALAIVEFTPGGEVIDASPAFLRLMDYSLEAIRGEHHRLFCDPVFAASPAYGTLWQTLRQGRAFSDLVQRRARNGRQLWLEVDYLPVVDASGVVQRVVTLVRDVTEPTRRAQAASSFMQAIDRSMATIEFDLAGRVVTANTNFLQVMGYRLEEIHGQHHRMFCLPEEAQSDEYLAFWASLNRGDYRSGLFQRVNRQGASVWLQATYNPLFDASGRLYGVIKFAQDISTRVEQRQRETRAAQLAFQTSMRTDEHASEGTQVVQQTVSVVQGIAEELQQVAEDRKSVV